MVALVNVGGVDCTLGVGVASCTLGVCVAICTLGVGCISWGGFKVGLKVTLLVIVVCMIGSSVVVAVGILFSSLSNFWSASILTVPLVFCLSFKACVRLFNALTIVSSGVKVGAVMCLCLKWTVSDILSLLECLTYITRHR